MFQAAAYSRLALGETAETFPRLPPLFFGKVRKEEMPNKEYSELLRSPHWQRKRLEVLSSADFKCQQCGDGDSNLQVHHKKYRKAALPWEYPIDNFTVLCDHCHKMEHAKLSSKEIELEQRIQEAYDKALATDDRTLKRKCHEDMVALIKLRSPDHVKKLETVKGLIA